MRIGVMPIDAYPSTRTTLGEYFNSGDSWTMVRQPTTIEERAPNEAHLQHPNAPRVSRARSFVANSLGGDRCRRRSFDWWWGIVHYVRCVESGFICGHHRPGAHPRHAYRRRIGGSVRVAGVAEVAGNRWGRPCWGDRSLVERHRCGPTADGFLSVRPGDASGTPSTSSLNFKAGEVMPNSVQVGLPTSGANGQIDITYDALGATPGPTTEVLIDVVGYMVAGGGRRFRRAASRDRGHWARGSEGRHRTYRSARTQGP